MVVVVGLVCLFFVLIGLQRDIGRNALSQNQEVCVQLLFRGINQISSVFFLSGILLDELVHLMLWNTLDLPNYR